MTTTTPMPPEGAPGSVTNPLPEPKHPAADAAAELEAKAAAQVNEARAIRAGAAQAEITATVQAILKKYGATVSVRAAAPLANGGAIQIDTADFALVVKVGDLPAASSVPGVNG